MPAIELVHGDLTERIIGVFYQVYNELGSGLLESAYQRAMEIALRDEQIACQREFPIAAFFRGRSIGEYRVDFIVENAVVLECKTAEKIVPLHRVQLLNYLKITKKETGLVLNFGPSPTFSRVVSDPNRSR